MWLYAVGALVAIVLARKTIDYTRYASRKRKQGCVDPPSYRHKDPVLGADLLFRSLNALRSGNYLDRHTELFRHFKSKTFKSQSFGVTTYHTIDPEVVKQYQSIHFSEFGYGPLRYHLAPNLWGNGIPVADGEPWAAARSFIRSSFDIVHTANIQRLEHHVDKFMKLLPMDGSTVDLLPLLKRLTLDTSSEFIFGESFNALDKPDPAFVQTFEYAQRGTGMRMLLGRFKFLHRDKKWYEACKQITDFCQKSVDEAIERVEKGKARRTEKDRLRLVDEAAKATKDRYTLRSLVLSVFSPAHDGAAVALSNVFFHLARNPRVWQKLRDEVTHDMESPLTYDSLNSYTYLKNVFRETHRFTPLISGNQRICLSDCVFPCGGGVGGTKPLYVRKGSIIDANYYTMMRDPDFWGPDADEFLPERWQKVRPGWEYTPFGGGPRACPGTRLVFVECAYTAVRIIRAYAKLENRDDEPDWKEKMRMTWQSKNGTLIGLIPA